MFHEELLLVTVDGQDLALDPQVLLRVVAEVFGGVFAEREVADALLGLPLRQDAPEIALQTGRRLAEIAALTWSDLRFYDDGRATITFQRCKGGKTMRDTIPPALTRTLLGWLQAFYGRQLGDLPLGAWRRLMPSPLVSSW